MATRMQQRRGTAAQWATVNPILADGEIGLEKDTGIVKMGDGTTNWNLLPPILQGAYLPTDGTAFDAQRLDGLDSTAFAQTSFVAPDGADRTLINHFGAVTAFPASNARIGDRCFRTDLYSDFYYTGSAWRQTEDARCGKTQRTSMPTADLYAGFRLYETDTKYMRMWDGTQWLFLGKLGGENPFIYVSRGSFAWPNSNTMMFGMAQTINQDTSFFSFAAGASTTDPMYITVLEPGNYKIMIASALDAPSPYYAVVAPIFPTIPGSTAAAYARGESMNQGSGFADFSWVDTLWLPDNQKIGLNVDMNQDGTSRHASMLVQKVSDV